MTAFYLSLQILILYGLYVYAPIQLFYMIFGVCVTFTVIYIFVSVYYRDSELTTEDKIIISLGMLSSIPSLTYKLGVFIFIVIVPLAIVTSVIYYSSFLYLWLFVPWVALFFGLAVIEDCGQRHEAGKKIYKDD